MMMDNRLYLKHEKPKAALPAALGRLSGLERNA